MCIVALGAAAGVAPGAQASGRQGREPAARADRSSSNPKP